MDVCLWSNGGKILVREILSNGRKMLYRWMYVYGVIVE
jgi:hypothetical protein